MDDLFTPTTAANPAAPKPRRRADVPKDPAIVRQNKNNKARGNAEELIVARLVGGRKVGPMGWPWDVETRTARLQVKKLARKPSRNAIGKLILAIPYRTDALRAFVWSDRSRPTNRTVYVIGNEWEEWHGGLGDDLIESMPLEDFIAIHGSGEEVA